jgi:regulator of protease activity HflC (stomatin/prohibitin superfamily)
MLFLKFLLICGGTGLFAAAALVLGLDVYRRARNGSRHGREDAPVVPRVETRWSVVASLAALAWVALLAGLSIVVIPSGQAAVRLSQVSGVVPGTLYAGTHFVVPLVQSVRLYSIRDNVYNTLATADARRSEPALVLQTREGLSVGLAVSVRYRLDPQRLTYLHTNLPQPVETQIVPAVVASAFREMVPNYMIREVFATKREEVRRQAAEMITRRLAGDGVLVKEVMVRDVALPAEYAKGLEGLLIKEQESERLTIEIEVKEKAVRTAELEAEADKMRQVKAAEAQAQVVVLQAKAQADAMQHTLPLKEKQIQQTRLEAEARKEATVKNAEAMAQAKVIDSKAELERQQLMAKAEEQRIRLIAGADAERMRAEAEVLKENPLLIQKIIAERLSDKVQIMMVPMDGRFFFANDVLKAPSLAISQKQDDRQ